MVRGRSLLFTQAQLVALAALAGCGVDDGGPRLASATPSAAGHGAMVILSGSRLCGEAGNCDTAAGQVQLGLSLPTVRATVLDYTDVSATIRIPDAAPVGRTELVVTVNEKSSNALAFEVLP